METTLNFDVGVEGRGGPEDRREDQVASCRTGVSARVLRYYEEQGLVAPARTTNAYRTYDEQDVARVEQVPSAWYPARVPAPGSRGRRSTSRTPAPRSFAPSCARQVAEMLAEELTGLDERIACLTRSRRALCDYLQRTEHATAVLEGAVTAAVS